MNRWQAHWEPRPPIWPNPHNADEAGLEPLAMLLFAGACLVVAIAGIGALWWALS